MGPASSRFRCLHCGTSIVLPAPASAPVQWYACPRCGSPVPAVPARDPAPLFTWEIYPHLYPPLPPPRVPRLDASRVAAALLIVATVVVVGAGGFLLYLGVVALAPTTYTVAGVVDGTPAAGFPSGPLANASVNVSGENGFHATVATAPDGSFAVGGVPAGGISVNASAPGFAPATVELFASKDYVSSPTQSVRIDLVRGTLGNGTTTLETPFVDLESFLASLWSGTILLGLAAVVAGVGAVAVVRRDRPVVGVAGGMGIALSPLALSLLGVLVLFPMVFYLSEALVILGLVAAILLIARMARVGRAADPD